MKKLMFLVLTLLFLTTLAHAQSDGTPAPRPTPNPLIENQQTQDAMNRADDLNRRSDALRMTQEFPVKVPEKEKAFRELIEPLYRNSTEEEMTFMAPDPDDSAPYRDFLKQKNTGIIKLVADRGCADNAKVVNASLDCSKYPMPGAGSGYSFRFGDYRMHHLSDIVFRNGKFESLGVLDHGIMVDLGDVPIDSVTEKSEGDRKSVV